MRADNNLLWAFTLAERSLNHGGYLVNNTIIKRQFWLFQ